MMSNTTTQLTLWQRLSLEMLWILCRGFALLPHFVRHHIFGTLCTFILRDLIHYRRAVIMDNLRRSFPDKSEADLNRICRGTYANLSEQIINTISQSGVSE